MDEEIEKQDFEENEEMAGGPGIEPGFLEPKSNVLPLDDPPTEAAL